MDRRHLAGGGPVTSPTDPRPHWARMTPDGGPTWPDDAEIIKWRAAAFAKSRRFVEEEPEQTQAAGMFDRREGTDHAIDLGS